MADDNLKKDLAGALGKKAKSTKGKLDSLKKGATENSSRLGNAAADRIARARAGAGSKESASHKVAAGDSLSAIAQKHYGSADKWQAIYDANKALIGDNPNAIKVGQELVLPDLD